MRRFKKLTRLAPRTKSSWAKSIIWLASSMLLLLSCEKKSPDASPGAKSDQGSALPPGVESWPACITENCHKTWNRLRILGMDAGSEMRQRCFCKTPMGRRIMVSSSGRFAFLRQGTKIKQVVKEKVLMDHKGRLLRYYRSEGQQEQPSTVVQSGKIGDELLTVRGPEKIRSKWQPKGLAGPLFARILWGSNLPMPGQRLSVSVFSHRTGTYSTHEIEVIDKTQNGHILLDIHENEAPGVITTMELDSDLNIIKERSRFGKLTIESIVLEKKPENAIPDKLPDISRFMTLNTSGSMERPESVCRARYRLKGLPSRIHPEDLNGPGQIASSSDHGAVDVLVSAIEQTSQPAKSIPERLKPFLKPTALVASDDDRIKNIAMEQTKDTKTTMQAAQALRNWVAHEIRSDMGMSFASALEVLHTGRGDCSEKSVLLVALARSIGIPARAVIGLVFDGREFAGHMWCEVWTGRWIPLDASFEPTTVSAARIRLGLDFLKMGQQNVDKTAMAEVLAAGTSVEILSTSHWKKDGTCPSAD